MSLVYSFKRNHSACDTCTIVSQPPEAMRLPSGDHATDAISLVWLR
jgi:hypothetical protein